MNDSCNSIRGNGVLKFRGSRLLGSRRLAVIERHVGLATRGMTSSFHVFPRFIAARPNPGLRREFCRLHLRRRPPRELPANESELDPRIWPARRTNGPAERIRANSRIYINVSRRSSPLLASPFRVSSSPAAEESGFMSFHLLSVRAFALLNSPRFSAFFHASDIDNVADNVLARVPRLRQNLLPRIYFHLHYVRRWSRTEVGAFHQLLDTCIVLFLNVSRSMDKVESPRALAAARRVLHPSSRVGECRVESSAACERCTS